jgi:hypothetical protein
MRWGISRCIKNYSCVSLPMMELEKIVYTTVVQEAIEFRLFLHSLNVMIHADDIVIIYHDNTYAIAYTRGSKYNGKSKYINTKYYFI